ncbi:GNAT family N-acetyltransferase [Acinetobacter bereziniae]|uniref:GNAT family N-acetyltransferase n=2 Tax=Acinetobacter bereziniae TaxID=106648 RepID=UPI001D18B5B7|nr:GNAT family N-acetyltransferase [Acinetobacter bereziniae]MDG3556758.1 GNAT family N-acetyltransferase [Acinetobacter bereziniae]MDP5999983.1 GNAT family N-acetyltransferase [Acinetobacter bereziniae]UUN95531.1 GNAT family N-acetyltransferase [Acinetobacter bereziniae]WMW76478.1 GNAT family N-acetyltransferase [Acinetobacter bereziniae]
MMKIRYFQPQDMLPLSELFLESRKKSWSWLDSSKWQLGDFEVSTQNEIVLVAENNQQYLGFASIYLQDNFLHHLFVAPSVQNQGVGSTLLASAEKLFNDTGYLKCLSENKTALAFYKHHAWKAVSTGESGDGAYVLMSKEKIIK